jgi:hypothetical protein
MAEKKVLVDVEIKATEALENLAKLKIRVAQLKGEQKALREEQKNSKPTNDKELKAYQEKEFKLAEVSQQIKHQSTLIRSYEKEIQNNIIAEKAQGDSLDALKAKLSLATAEYNSLSKAARQDVYGQEKAQEIKQLTEELTEAETAVGNFHRQVGNYELAGKGLRTTIMDMTEELTIMKLEGKEATEEYRTLASQLATFKDAMGDVQNEAKGAASDTSNLDALNQSLQGVIGTFGAYSAIMGLSAEDSEEFERVLQKMQVAVTAIISLTAIQNTLQKDSIVYQKARIILDKVGLTQAKATAGAEAALNIIRGKATIGTKALAVAQLLWNKALLANPVVLLASAIATLVIGVYALTKAFDDSKSEQEKLNREMEKTNSEIKRIKEDADFNVAIAEASGASKEELRKLRTEAVKTSEALAYANWTRVLNNKKATQEQRDNAKQAYEEAYEDLKQHNMAMTIEDVKSRGDRAKKAKEDAKKSRDDRYNSLLASIEVDKAFSEKEIELDKLSKESSFVNDKDYEAKAFKLKQDTEKKKLEVQKQYGKITQKQYNEGLIALAQNEEIFRATQKRSIEEAYKAKIEMLDKNIVDEEKALRKAAKKEQDDWIAIMEAKYDEEYKKTEAYAIERDNFIFKSKLKLEEDIQKLNGESIVKQIEDIERAVNEQYEGDLQKYSDNERQKTTIEIEQLQERIRLKKEAGLSVFEDEAQLRASTAKLNNIALNTELLNENLTAQQRYELKKASIEAELELYRGNIDKEKELEAELAEISKQYQRERIGNFEMWAGKISEIASELNNFTKALEEQELQDYEEKNQQKKDSYQAQLDSGIISKQEYDAKIKQSDLELDKKKAEIARKQAIREKALKVFEIGINTATAIMKIWAEVPKMDFGISTVALTAAAAVLGAVQLAAVASTPIPKASRGMLLQGKSHAQGGMLIEAEGGEAIINKRSTMMFTPLLSAINQAGGGIALGSDGGYAMRHSAGGELSAKDIEMIVEKTISSQKIFVTVEDIRKEDKKYAKMESRGNW